MAGADVSSIAQRMISRRLLVPSFWLMWLMWSRPFASRDSAAWRCRCCEPLGYPVGDLGLATREVHARRLRGTDGVDDELVPGEDQDKRRRCPSCLASTSRFPADRRDPARQESHDTGL